MNSSLVTYTNLTSHHSGKRTHDIDRITPHCIVGQWTAKQGCDYFKTTNRECSANYVIGKDGDIGLSVEEHNRSWCSSSNANDQRAITIECASSVHAPYEMTDNVFNSLVTLCTDICTRLNKTKLLWINNKEKALNYVTAPDEMLITVHRWFSNKSCPGDWLYSRLDKLAEQVTERLADNVKAPLYVVQIGAYRNRLNAERQLDKAKKAGFSDAYITTKNT